MRLRELSTEVFLLQSAWCLLAVAPTTQAFSIQPSNLIAHHRLADGKSWKNSRQGTFASYRSSALATIHRLANNDDMEPEKSLSEYSFDPFHTSSQDWSLPAKTINDVKSTKNLSMATLLPPFLLLPTAAIADSEIIKSTSLLNKGDFNPESFRPVCQTSDTFYRLLQSTTASVVGDDNFVEYGPLIAGGLLRIRLELCVVESFFNEAVGPFIQKEGLSWILPLHETVETFLAGTIFALATTFILVGSTKIVSVICTYSDVFIGVPCRLIGGFAFDRSTGKPVVLDLGIGPFKKRVIGPGSPKEDAEKKKNEENNEFLDLENIDVKVLPLIVLSGSVKLVGETSKVLREVLEALDLFVGRYLTLIATGYIGIKFLHFKVFPDFPPF